MKENCLERGMNCDKRQQLYRCFVKMGSKGTPIVKNPGPKDVALRKHPLAVRAVVVRRTHKSEAPRLNRKRHLTGQAKSLA